MKSLILIFFRYFTSTIIETSPQCVIQPIWLQNFKFWSRSDPQNRSLSSLSSTCLASRWYFGHKLEVMDINVSFDIIIRRASLRKYESEWYSKPASVATRAENLFLNLHRLCSTTNNLFCEDCETIFQVTASHSRSGRRAWLEWSLSRQMSDNTIVWWVWMTGSRRSRRLFSVLFSFCGTCQNADMADNRLLVSKGWETRCF